MLRFSSKSLGADAKNVLTVNNKVSRSNLFARNFFLPIKTFLKFNKKKCGTSVGNFLKINNKVNRGMAMSLL